MRIRPRHWLTALGLAMIAHLGIAYWLQSLVSPPSVSTRKNLSISLAPAGSAVTDSPTATASNIPMATPVPPEAIKAVTPETTVTRAVAPPSATAMIDAPTAKSAVSSKSLSEKTPHPAPNKTKIDGTDPESRREPIEPPHRPVPSSLPSAKSLSSPRKESTPPADSSAVSDKRSGQSQNPAPKSGVADSVTATPLPGNPKPTYPRIARRRGFEGQVVIQVSITSVGTVARATIERSSGHGILDSTALRTVERWRFQPARRHGRPVGVTLDIPITFRLQDG